MKKPGIMVSWVLGLVLLSSLLCAVSGAENYPDFGYVQQDQSTSTVTTETVPEAMTATEFSKLKPNNYPNFAFRKSEPAGTKEEKTSADSSKHAAVPDEVKPNNYPNFEFRTEDVSTQEVKGFQSDAAATSFERVQENKPNNYPNFEFKESTAVSQYQSLFGQEKTPRSTTTTTTTPDSSASAYRGSDASGRYASSFDVTNVRHRAEVRGASTQGSQFSNGDSFSTSQVKLPSSSSTYRGSDPYGRYPSSFELTNARHQAQSQSQTQQQFSNKDFTTYNPSTTSNFRSSDTSGRSFSSFDLTNARYQASHSQQTSQVSSETASSVHRGSDPSGRYPSSFDLTNARHQASYVYNAEEGSASHAQFSSGKVFGDDSSAYRFNAGNEYSTTQVSDEASSFPKFNYNIEDASSNSKARFWTSMPTTFPSQFASSSTATGSSGCSSSYWSSHTSKWPRFFTNYSKVTDAFPGAKVQIVYGTTTLLQALYDTRPDGYSQLLNHGVAALLNAYDKPSHYEYSHTTVIELFTSALASRTTAAQQALKFENANTAYGTEGCSA